MKTRATNAPEQSVTEQLADRASRQLAELETRRIAPFVAHYVDDVSVRPLLLSGMLCERKEANPDCPERRFLILVDEDQSPTEIARTLFHELIHVFLLVVGIPREHHDEVKIERCATALAGRHPEISAIVKKVFPAARLPV